MQINDERHQYRALISEGDEVLIYIDERRSKIVKVRKGAIFQSDKGILKLDDVIGLEWGSRVRLSTGAYAWLLKPLFLDYLEKSFRRVTQVIYPKDLGLILLLSSIYPGAKVLEGGVGTGFLTATLANFVGPQGHVYAYELRREFAEVARSNLKKLGLLDRVTIKIADIRRDVKEENIDAAILDIPDPWEAIDTLKNALKPSSPIITFLPTINQVIKLLKTLRTRGDVVDVKVFDSILREYIVDPEALRPRTHVVGHTGYIVFFRIVK